MTTLTATTAKTKWNLDASHSEVNFKVKHLMITNVSGSFGKFDIQTQTDGNDFTSAEITFTANTSSISTNSEQRDGHIKSGDFFDVENFPEMTFVSTSLTKKDEENYELAGNLTIKDITKPVKLHVEFGGLGIDPWGQQKAGFSVSGKINRTEWNLNWNSALETGGFLLGDDVKIFAEIQLIKEA